ncbi:MAG: nucleoside hydrolase [Anaerolineaceae bacterium]|nr:nucleoside hydrolase [Anaerolineaceae bacterium]
MPVRVILDTDIGTDVDDWIALALVLSSSELTLEGVTCVYADVAIRARMVLKLMQLRGYTGGAPVMEGVRDPLLKLDPLFWMGHEGKGLLEPEDSALEPAPEHAVDYIVRTVMANPGQIHLVCIGPLTNAALAFLREPKLAENLAHLTIMGGVLRSTADPLMPIAEHNIRCDPEAAHVVFSSGAPITLVPLDVTTRVKITTDDVKRLRERGTPYHQAIAQQIDVWLEQMAQWFGQKRDYTHMHDPLAVATLIQPDLVTLTPVNLTVELAGTHSRAATLMRAPSEKLPVNVHAALDVDVDRFESLLMERLLR